MKKSATVSFYRTTSVGSALVFFALVLLQVQTAVARLPVTSAADAPSKDSKIEKLNIAKIALAGQSITAEMAVTFDERERGLMYRKSLGVNEGMLFVFESPEPMAFWMKNTLIPLSIGYFDAEKRLINSVEMTPAIMGEVQPKTYPALRPAKYALEMNKGWFTKHGVKPGAILTIPSQAAH